MPAAHGRRPSRGQIVAMRHVLVHVYWGVDNDQLWNTVTAEVPAMLPLVEKALAEWPNL